MVPVASILYTIIHTIHTFILLCQKILKIYNKKQFWVCEFTTIVKLLKIYHLDTLWRTRDEFEELFKEVKWIKKAVDREISQVTFTYVGYLGYCRRTPIWLEDATSCLLTSWFILLFSLMLVLSGWLSSYHVWCKTVKLRFFCLYFT